MAVHGTIHGRPQHCFLTDRSTIHTLPQHHLRVYMPGLEVIVAWFFVSKDAVMSMVLPALHTAQVSTGP